MSKKDGTTPEYLHRLPSRLQNDQLIHEVFGDWEDDSEDDKPKSPERKSEHIKPTDKISEPADLNPFPKQPKKLGSAETELTKSVFESTEKADKPFHKREGSLASETSASTPLTESQTQLKNQYKIDFIS